ncbi:MAG: hypothetical protein WD079_01385 [Phycisphaeraceae bacterium]
MTIPTLLAESGGNPLANVFMAAGVAMIIMLLVINTRGKLRRRGSATLNPHEKVERIKQTHGMKNDMRNMMVELEELTRRFSAQLDAKAVRLERLIDEADERLAQLEAMGSGRRTDAAPQPPEEGNRPAPPEAAESPTEPEPEEPLDPLSRNVYDLADAGHEPIAIARKLREQVGKVELILALRQ